MKAEACSMLFPAADHDHARCVAAILAEAEQVCQRRQTRLTLQRRRVLQILAESHAAIGAYEIIDRMAGEGRRPVPITVYRALDFLMENGLVHRLASLNAFIACAHPQHQGGAQFLICHRCQTIGELNSDAVGEAIAATAAAAGFAVSQAIVEISGVCHRCCEASDAAP
jgi:Fur family zinc uptake transcriptional regulator